MRDAAYNVTDLWGGVGGSSPPPQIKKRGRGDIGRRWGNVYYLDIIITNSIPLNQIIYTPKNHKTYTNGYSHLKYYIDTTKLCAEEWAKIADLEGRSLSPKENEHLTTMKRKLCCTFSRLPNE